MQAKFDEIMVPITRDLIVEDQQEYVVFDAFFGNTTGWIQPESRATSSSSRG